MTTNELLELVAVIKASLVAAPVVSATHNEGWWTNPTVVAALVLIAGQSASYLQSRTAAINARDAKDSAAQAVKNSDEQKVIGAKVAENVAAIHTAVNSKETATAAENKRLGDIVLKLTEENATQAQQLVENQNRDVRRQATKDAAK